MPPHGGAQEMDLRKVRTWFVGRPLRTRESGGQGIGVWAGIPVLGLDALASSAYGPEAALTVLLPLGRSAVGYMWGLALLIVGLLMVVQFSYRQTVAAYPDGGGSYTVAGQNLGRRTGLVAAAALWLDYVLNAAVGISAGVGALVSAEPRLLPFTLELCLGILLFLTIINLRGVRDSGTAFMAPTYLFVISLGGVILLSTWRTLLSGGHPTAQATLPQMKAAASAASWWILLRAFASGCTAMTGIEAVSNAVPVFREPRVRQATRTLTCISAILALLTVGIAVACRAYGIVATEPGQAGYQSVLSQVTMAVVGRGALYYVTMAAVTAVLCLSANTSFADFPRLCRLLATDGFLPARLGWRGPRLVYSSGIVLLAALVALLLVVFGGVTDRLIPLFAVGAFLAFTLSQAGMVMHWWRAPRPLPRAAFLLNALGATSTGAALLVIIVSKFTEGAWVTALAIPALLLVFRRVHARRELVQTEIAAAAPLDVNGLQQPIVVVPLRGLDRVARKALRLALTVSTEVIALQLLSGEDDETDLTSQWSDLVERPCQGTKRPPPQLVVLRSQFREVVDPVVRHVQRLGTLHPGRLIVVIVPELVERRWYHRVLRNHRATTLKARLLLQGFPDVVIANTPWYVGEPRRRRARRREAGRAPGQ